MRSKPRSIGCPLSYLDSMARGEILSRVTSDIDNVSQSLQQTLSQALTSLLTVVGVIVMMIWVSPVLSIIALVTIPISMVVTATIAKRSQKKFMNQWKNTGQLNAQIEEAFSGHTLVKVFGHSAQVEAKFAEKNQEMFLASFGGQFLSGLIMPAMMFIGNLNYAMIAVVGGLRVAGGALNLGRRAGLYPIFTHVHHAAVAAGCHGESPAVRRRLGRTGVRIAGRSRNLRGGGRYAQAHARSGRVRTRFIRLRSGQTADHRPVADC